MKNGWVRGISGKHNGRNIVTKRKRKLKNSGESLSCFIKKEYMIVVKIIGNNCNIHCT